MTFHDTLWVLTGGAAPVIALAAIVSLRDVLSDMVAMSDISDELNAPYTKEGLAKTFRFGDRWSLYGIVQWWAQVGNLGLQAFLLTISLLSVAWQRNVFPVWIAVAVPVAGVVLLAETGIAMMLGKGVAGMQRNKLRLDLALPVRQRP